jgi:hypothetical protein
MRALEPFDEKFLTQDRGVNVGHIGALLPFEAADASAELSVEHLRDLIDERLERLPFLRRRVEPDPSRPGRHGWAEDEAVDLSAHVRGHRLAGGDDRALGRLVAQINASLLDRARPLWEMHVIDGLDGGRVAVLLKYHHALGDAIPVRLVLDTLFGIGEDPPPPTRGLSAIPRREAPDANATPPSAQVVARRIRFNRPLSPERDFAFGAFASARVERIRLASGTTHTAVLLAAWAGALRGWLALRGETPTMPLAARMPISLRRAGDDAASGNHLAVMSVPAPADQGDALARLRGAHDAMTQAKELLASGAWAGAAQSPVNFGFSAYLGSNRQLAWHGAPGAGIYSLAMLNISGLSIACGTDRGRLLVGLHVDAEQVTDPWSLLRAFDLALADLETAVAG